MTPRLSLAAAALTAATVLTYAAGAGASVSPPPATGPAPVGLERLTLVDHHRHEHPAAPRGGPRVVPLRVWYPAAAPGAQHAPVLSPAEQSTYEGMFSLSVG